MEIREVTETDLPQLLTLYTHLHGNPIPEQSGELSALWQKILRDENQHLLVVDEEGELVSSCVLVIIPNLTHGQRPYALIENVVTQEDCRGHGYAGACLGYAKELASRAGCYKIMLMTGSKQEQILRFYRKAGYNSEDKTAFIQWL